MPSRPKSSSLADAIAVSIPETGQMLRVGHSTVHQLLNSGHLDSFRIGRARRITVESIRRVAQDGAPGRSGSVPSARSKRGGK